MSGQGLDNTPIRWPREYDPAFFDRLFREVLALADARNVIAGPGIAVSGGPPEPATISASDELAALLAASFVTATSAALDNERVLTGEPGVVNITDNGAGTTIEVSLALAGIALGKLALIPGLSVLASQSGDFSTVDAVQSSADGQVFRRLNGELGWGLVPDDSLPTPEYLVQTEQAVFYTADDFVKGTTIIGVRYASGESFVYIPNDLESEHIVIVKDEAGLGMVRVRPYSVNYDIGVTLVSKTIVPRAAVISA